MTLNFTMIIQALNFGIAFWLLRTFIFKPIVADILQEEQQESAYRERIAALEYNVDLARQDLAYEYESMRSALEHTYPKEQSIKIFSFDDLQLDSAQLQPSMHEKVALQKKLEEALRDKVIL